MSHIYFFSEDVIFALDNPAKSIRWIRKVISLESHKSISNINFIFCSDDYLHQVNLDYLKHDAYTDIITFDNSEDPKLLDADIYISIERVRDNSSAYKVSIENELHRVMVHGILHLLGFPDSSAIEKEIMQKKENEYLTLLENRCSTWNID